VPRYFVTGATGFIGSELAKQLISRGHHVVALVRSAETATFLRALGAELHLGDVTDLESLWTPMTDVQGVFHVAGWHKFGVRGPDGERINVDGTRNVLQAMQETGVTKGVYTSTVAVFGDTRQTLADESYFSPGPFLSEYQRTKWKAHYEVALPRAEAGCPLVIAMPGVVYGPGDRSEVRATLVRLLAGRLPALATGSHFCWSYVEDTARGLIQCMESGRSGESYLLTGPVHPFEDVMDEAARLAGRRPVLIRLRPGVTRAASAVVAGLEAVGLRGPFASEGLRMLAGTTWIGSNEKARRELGFNPRSLEDGLRPTIEHELRLMGRT